MPHIYRLARDAGMEPTGFCAIDNACFSEPAAAGAAAGKAAAGEAAQPPLFTPAAQAAEGRTAGAARLGAPQFSSALPSGLRKLWIDATEYIEDPVPSARAIFGKQKQMSQIREYDASGYRVPATVGFAAPASAIDPEPGAEAVQDY